MTPAGRDAVQFTRESAERIANVVRAAELTPRGGRALNFEPLAMASNRKTFRMGTFTGAWPIGAASVVTLRGSTTTLAAQNLLVPLPSSGQRNCAIARDGTAWYLVQPQLYAANAATAATLTTASLEFKTLPVVALATQSTVVFSVSVSTCSTAAT